MGQIIKKLRVSSGLLDDKRDLIENELNTLFRTGVIHSLIEKGVAEGVVVLVRTLGRTIRRVVRQALGLDGSDRRQERRQERRDSMRRRFSDTPGMQRLQRETAMTFAAGDRVIAARSDAGLRAQMGGGSGPLSVTTVLDVRDGPVRLGMAVAANREIRRSGIGTDSTGRGRVY